MNPSGVNAPVQAVAAGILYFQGVGFLKKFLPAGLAAPSGSLYTKKRGCSLLQPLF